VLPVIVRGYVFMVFVKRGHGDVCSFLAIAVSRFVRLRGQR
jgi:hypothetical protein